ncbi:MAG: hypothetical protein LBG26_02985 [Treponema sp.]|jgi:hypothetical protein|nr:hypothetical protein [Treponema sp.]
MKYKVGDTVRIRSKEWMDAQEKDDDGDILGPSKAKHYISEEMQKYAGKTVKIIIAEVDCYCLYIDEGACFWEDWMFDPDYKADAPLPAEDAIRAMLDGETLHDKDGYRHDFSELRGDFIRRGTTNGDVTVISKFSDLYRRPIKHKRPMTRWEILNWVSSEASRGWVVRPEGGDTWSTPQFFNYDMESDRYQRARLLSDLSGVDESNIQGFEVEE